MFFKRKYLSYIIISVAVLYLYNKAVLSGISNTTISSLFRSYFNDVLAPIFLIAFSNLLTEIRGFGQIMAITLSAGLIWEYFAPLIKPTAVSDPLDMLAYAVGGIVIYMIFRKDKQTAVYDKSFPGLLSIRHRNCSMGRI